MEEMIKGLLSQPATWAILSKFAVDFIKSYLKKVDTEHMVDHYRSYVQLAVAIFSGLAAFLMLALQGHAAEFDPKPIVEWGITLWLASQGVNAAAPGIKAAFTKDASK